MRTLRLLALITLSMTAAAQTVIPLQPFRSIELHNGGNVTVRHGPAHRVTMLAGDPRYTDVRVERGHLVIGSDRQACPRGYRLQVEVVTPELSEVSVFNGGTLQLAGAFPAQASITATVEQGGTIDIRSIATDAVAASIESGGGIFTTARRALAATINSGGAVTYWGDPRVEKNVRDGGVVQQGKTADADKPLSEMNPRMPLIAPIPPVPPIP